MPDLTVSVIGLGYIGLPTATMFASRKVKVIGVDINAETVATVNRGGIHIVEPDLDIAVHGAVSGGYLRATTKPEPADAFLIAVPTPFKGTDHEPDLGYIEAAARAIAPVLKSGNLVVLESTSPVGTTEQMAAWLAESRPDLSFPHSAGEESDIRVAHCPERVLPGKIMQELIHNDRIIGGMTPRCSEEAVALYKTFVEGNCLVSNARTAEMVKLTENSFRDVNIAFANELSMICDELEINVWQLIELANCHPRVNILRPGAGVGGHCIAVDPWFVVHSAPQQSRLLRAAREVNDRKPGQVANHIISLAKQFHDPAIACFGLTYKPDVDDVRESPAMQIVEKLSDEGYRILLCEPHLDELPDRLHSKDIILTDADTACEQCDVVAFLVGHTAFNALKLADFKAKPIVDAIGLFPRTS